MKHICQGPNCHTYETQSRVRGPKGNKVLRTRVARYDMNIPTEWARNWEYYFCDERCLHDWIQKHTTQLINYVGLKTKPSETPVDVIKGTIERWGNTYNTTTIKLLNEPTQDDTITA
jgi:hypothetical protein